MKPDALDEKFADMARSFRASPPEVQGAMFEIVTRVASSFAGAELAMHSIDDTCAFLVAALEQYARRKEDELRQPIGKQKR